MITDLDDLHITTNGCTFQLDLRYMYPECGDGDIEGLIYRKTNICYLVPGTEDTWSVTNV